MGRSADAFIHYGVKLPARENPDTYEDQPWVAKQRAVLEDLGVDPDDDLEVNTLFFLMTGEKPASEDNDLEWDAQQDRLDEWKRATELELKGGGHCDGGEWDWALTVGESLYWGEVGITTMDLGKFQVPPGADEKLRAAWDALGYPAEEFKPSWLLIMTYG